jgi:hypothetical protein
MSGISEVHLAIHGERDRRVHKFYANWLQTGYKMHSNCTNMTSGWGKTLFCVRPVKPRVETWWFTCQAVVSVYSCGNPDRSLVAQRVLMTQNTLFSRRFYRAERILVVRTAIRASRGAVRTRLEGPPVAALVIWPPRPNQLRSPFKWTHSAFQKFLVRVTAAATRFQGPFISQFEFIC